jgi:glycosyltransferase involved in cell wall biosynthesis
MNLNDEVNIDGLENSICLNKRFSTTRLITKEKPKMINNSDDTFESRLFLPASTNPQNSGGLRNKGYFKKSYKERPLVSIITVVYNDKKCLVETILSVINQTYDNVEFIIIDGGSTDGTLDIIRKYENCIDYWISEKDSGIYYAMNKGIKTVSGGWINFMNAGDSFYHSGMLQSIFFRKELHKSKLIYGNVSAYSKEYAIIRKVGRAMDPNDVYMTIPTGHQAIFYSNLAFKEIGCYDTEYKVIADHEWFVRFYKKFGLKELLYIDEIIANYLMEGFSTQNTLLSAKERLNLNLNHFPFLDKRKEVFKYYVRYLRAIVMQYVKKIILYKKLMTYKYGQ